MSSKPAAVCGTGTVCQIGIVVRDIEKTARIYADLLGVEVPAFHLTGPSEETNIRYRGLATEARAKLVFFAMENITIELIEPVGRPSTWGEFLDAHGEGVHHIAFRVRNTDAQVALLRTKGMPVVQHGEYKGGQYTYIDSIGKLGVLLELLEND